MNIPLHLLFWTYRKTPLLRLCAWSGAIAMIASVWLVPVDRLTDVASWTLIVGGVFSAMALVWGTVRKDPALHTNIESMWTPIRTAMMTATFLPSIASSHGSICLWQAIGFWLKHAL